MSYILIAADTHHDQIIWQLLNTEVQQSSICTLADKSPAGGQVALHET